jgi:A/G-specific adenine glycosylase
MPTSSLHTPVLQWYTSHQRDLPWRRSDADGWRVLVSEIMLQQTPVTRVLPAYEAWIRRWPTPGLLAIEPAGEAVRMWGRLGYPRRALRLHAAAVLIDERFDGVVPHGYDELRSLPGIGDYTASAVAAFAYGQRALVLDTNVRRVLGRLLRGVQFPAASVTVAERELAQTVLPDDGETAAQWSVATMELGALLCVAQAPRCGSCPVREVCTWRLAGYPEYEGPPRRTQTYAGTDRQCRGRILALLRDADSPLPKRHIDAVWDDPAQRERALASLVDDGLVVQGDEGTLRLPG